MADRVRALELDIDFASGEVRRGGRLLKIPPRALEILSVLAERPCELVSRAEIRDAVWNGTHVDFDRSVNLYVSLLRKAFGDDARTPRYIETVPRKGYRFVAPIERPAERIRIVVLPFENLGPADDESLSPGMTDELMLQLGRLVPEGIDVIARTTAFSYVGTSKTASQIGRELRATHLIEGSIRRAGDEARIAFRLIQARNEAMLWSGAFQEKTRQHLELQSRIARAIASEIRIQLSPMAALGSGGTGRVPLEAYDLYLKGRHLFFSPQYAPNRRGLELLERSIALAPDFAAPRWRLAEALLWAASNSSVSIEAVRPIIQKNVDRALALEPDAAEAWACRAFLRVLLSWDWDGAKQDLDRAQTLGTSIDTLRLCGVTQLIMGRFDEALSGLVRAVELDPFSITTSFVAGWGLHRARRYSEAIDRLEKTVAIDPSGPTGLLFLADSHLREGNVMRARELCAKRLETASGPPMVLGYSASILARANRERGARALVARLETSSLTSFVDPYYLAAAHAGLGDTDVALDHLERADREHSCVMPLARFESFLDPLREDPRFDAVLEPLGLP